MTNDYSFALYHSGVKSQKWYNRRYQNPDGTWTEEGKARRREARAARALKAAYYEAKADKYTTKANKLYVKYTNKAIKYLNKYEDTKVSTIEAEFGREAYKTIKLITKGAIVGDILLGPIGAIAIGSITAVVSGTVNGVIPAYYDMKNG